MNKFWSEFHNCRFLLFSLLCFFYSAPAFSESLFQSRWKHEINTRNSFLNAYPRCRDFLNGKPVDREKMIMELQAASTSNYSYWKPLFLGAVLERSIPGGGAAGFKQLKENLNENIIKNWSAAVTLHKLGSPLYSEILSAAHKNMLLHGYLKIPEFSQYFLRKSAEEIDAYHFEAAHQYLDQAKMFDPYNPWVFLLKIEILLKENLPWNWNLAKIGSNIKHGFFRAARFENRSILYLNVLRSVRWSLSVFFAAFIFIIVLRYYPAAAHLWAEKIPGKIPMGFRYGVLAVIFFSVLTAFFGWIACSIFSIFALWYLMAKQEKIVACLFFICISLLPAWLGIETALFLHKNPQSIYFHYQQAYTSGWQNDLFQNTSDFLPADNKEAALKKATLSILYKKDGKTGLAYKSAHDAYTLDNRNLLVKNNMANNYFLNSEYEKAKKEYAKALLMAPDSPQLLFNMSQTELYLNNSRLHGMLLEKSLGKNYEYISDFIEFNDHYFISDTTISSDAWPILRRVLDLPIHSTIRDVPPLEFLKDAYKNEGKMKSGIIGIPLLVWSAAAFILLITLAVISKNSFFLSWGRNFFLCKLCLRIICNICRQGAFCGSCYQTTKNIADEKLRAAIADSLQYRAMKRKKLVLLIMNSVLPGSGMACSAPTALGYVFLLLTSALLGINLSMPFLIKDYPNYAMGTFKWIFITPLLIPYFYYPAALIHFLLLPVIYRRKKVS